MSGLVCIQSLL